MRLASTLYACARANQNSGWTLVHRTPGAIEFRVPGPPGSSLVSGSSVAPSAGWSWLCDTRTRRGEGAAVYTATHSTATRAPPDRRTQRRLPDSRRGRTSIALPSSWSCSRSGNLTEHAILGRARYPKEPIAHLTATTGGHRASRAPGRRRRSSPSIPGGTRASGRAARSSTRSRTARGAGGGRRPRRSARR
jgi:hypothetical protein